jgi:hypothetical protein
MVDPWEKKCTGVSGMVGMVDAEARDETWMLGLRKAARLEAEVLYGALPVFAGSSPNTTTSGCGGVEAGILNPRCELRSSPNQLLSLMTE